MHDWDNGHMDDGWGLAMLLGMVGLWVLLLVALGLAIFWVVRTSGAPGGKSTTPSSTGHATARAEQILAERLARGEIEPEEYRARLDLLRSSTPPEQ